MKSVLLMFLFFHLAQMNLWASTKARGSGNCLSDINSCTLEKVCTMLKAQKDIIVWMRGGEYSMEEECNIYSSITFRGHSGEVYVKSENEKTRNIFVVASPSIQQITFRDMKMMIWEDYNLLNIKNVQSAPVIVNRLMFQGVTFENCSMYILPAGQFQFDSINLVECSSYKSEGIIRVTNSKSLSLNIADSNFFHGKMDPKKMAKEVKPAFQVEIQVIRNDNQAGATVVTIRNTTFDDFPNGVLTVSMPINPSPDFKINIENTNFTECVADQGGAVYISTFGNLDVTLRHLKVSNVQARLNGGFVSADTSWEYGRIAFNLENSTFHTVQSSVDGGVFFLTGKYLNCTFLDNLFDNCNCFRNGGTLYSSVFKGYIVGLFERNTWKNGHALRGNALYIDNPGESVTLKVKDNKFLNGEAFYGCISVSGALATMEFEGNRFEGNYGQLCSVMYLWMERVYDLYFSHNYFLRNSGARIISVTSSITKASMTHNVWKDNVDGTYGLYISAMANSDQIDFVDETITNNVVGTFYCFDLGYEDSHVDMISYKEMSFENNTGSIMNFREIQVNQVMLDMVLFQNNRQSVHSVSEFLDDDDDDDVPYDDVNGVALRIPSNVFVFLLQRTQHTKNNVSGNSYEYFLRSETDTQITGISIHDKTKIWVVSEDLGGFHRFSLSACYFERTHVVADGNLVFQIQGTTFVNDYLIQVDCPRSCACLCSVQRSTFQNGRGIELYHFRVFQTVNNVQFRDNYGVFGGSVMATLQCPFTSSVYLSETSFIGGNATLGGAIFFTGEGGGGQMELDDVLIQGNEADYGSAFFFALTSNDYDFESQKLSSKNLRIVGNMNRESMGGIVYVMNDFSRLQTKTRKISFLENAEMSENYYVDSAGKRRSESKNVTTSPSRFVRFNEGQENMMGSCGFRSGSALFYDCEISNVQLYNLDGKRVSEFPIVTVDHPEPYGVFNDKYGYYVLICFDYPENCSTDGNFQLSESASGKHKKLGVDFSLQFENLDSVPEGSHNISIFLKGLKDSELDRTSLNLYFTSRCYCWLDEAKHTFCGGRSRKECREKQSSRAALIVFLVLGIVVCSCFVSCLCCILLIWVCISYMVSGQVTLNYYERAESFVKSGYSAVDGLEPRFNVFERLTQPMVKYCLFSFVYYLGKWVPRSRNFFISIKEGNKLGFTEAEDMENLSIQDIHDRVKKHDESGLLDDDLDESDSDDTTFI